MLREIQAADGGQIGAELPGKCPIEGRCGRSLREHESDEKSVLRKWEENDENQSWGHTTCVAVRLSSSSRMWAVGDVICERQRPLVNRPF